MVQKEMFITNIKLKKEEQAVISNNHLLFFFHLFWSMTFVFLTNGQWQQDFFNRGEAQLFSDFRIDNTKTPNNRND